MMLASGVSSCEVHISQQENFYKIPQHLLKAISLIESGRTIQPGQRVAWSWTINVNGRGYVYESKQQALDAVRKFQKQGKKSIDVGCMQINLKHHPAAFRHLEDAFDPQLNVAYAAQFLNNLKRKHGDWRTAVAHYHSAAPQFHQPYREKIHKQWGALRNSSGNMTPILHDLSYTSNSAMSIPSRQTPVPQTGMQKSKTLLQKKMDSSVGRAAVSPPGTFYPVNGQGPKKPEAYAKLTYRKFYNVLPQNQAVFLPVR